MRSNAQGEYLDHDFTSDAEEADAALVVAAARVVLFVNGHYGRIFPVLRDFHVLPG